MNTQCRLDSGDWVGSAWGASPELSPYGQAIADYYPIQIPWFLSTPITIGGTSPGPLVVTTRPQLYDVLIVGFSALVPTDSNREVIGVNITHKETGIPWAAPNTIGYAPLPALAGINNSVMPIIKLPEIFFLPARTQLKIEWRVIANETISSTAVVLTLVGIQVINNKAGFMAPQRITMPNGDVIPVGSRLPWFGTVPFGTRDIAGRAFGQFGLGIGQQVVQFLPPIDCNVEIHDAYTSVDTDAGVFDTNGIAILQTLKLTDMRSQSDWTPGLTPITAVFGNETQVYPALPFTKPHLLKTGHRTALTMQNNSTNFGVAFKTVTLRGIRLCEY